jgi:hypothetical protein
VKLILRLRRIFIDLYQRLSALPSQLDVMLQVAQANAYLPSKINQGEQEKREGHDEEDCDTILVRQTEHGANEGHDDDPCLPGKD